MSYDSKIFKNKKLNHIRNDWLSEEHLLALRLLSESQLLDMRYDKNLAEFEKVFEKAYGVAGSVYYPELLAGFYSIKESDSYEKFMEIDDSCSKAAFGLTDGFLHNDQILAYYRTLVLSKAQKPFLLESARMTSPLQLIEDISKSTQYRLTDREPISTPEEKEEFKNFLNSINDYYSTTKNNDHKTIFYILREVYGQSQVKYILDQIVQESLQISGNEIIDLLINWDSIKEYPISWAINLCSKEGD